MTDLDCICEFCGDGDLDCLDDCCNCDCGDDCCNCDCGDGCDGSSDLCEGCCGCTDNECSVWFQCCEIICCLNEEENCCRRKKQTDAEPGSNNDLNLDQANYTTESEIIMEQPRSELTRPPFEFGQNDNDNFTTGVTAAACEDTRNNTDHISAPPPSYQQATSNH